jgi:uncharacterized paraquat-inducible protein A
MAVARVSVGSACLLFGMALGLPVFSITPAMGELTGWLRLLRPDEMATTTQSLLGGIRLLWVDGDPLLSLILVTFCVILPLTKFLILWGECFGMPLGDSLWGRFCRATAPYAMVEVFVLALLVMVVKGLPGGSVIEVKNGAWCFAGSVILSLVAANLLNPRSAKVGPLS